MSCCSCGEPGFLTSSLGEWNRFYAGSRACQSPAGRFRSMFSGWIVHTSTFQASPSNSCHTAAKLNMYGLLWPTRRSAVGHLHLSSTVWEPLSRWWSPITLNQAPKQELVFKLGPKVEKECGSEFISWSNWPGPNVNKKLLEGSKISIFVKALTSVMWCKKCLVG